MGVCDFYLQTQQNQGVFYYKAQHIANCVIVLKYIFTIGKWDRIFEAFIVFISIKISNEVYYHYD